ncbi:hypothetical protein GCM10007938_12480 [Vibrio zhanjiangensis]|uniref:Uncharacterized protein n=1 Tax=Vibrio zhanjiangensis TaxID=1046128 RepID=A0ABQ6EXL9_9VIBR|nr:hypothetical protein GCM10007938_12480 [Vibrio zhanjiangensis]
MVVPQSDGNGNRPSDEAQTDDDVFFNAPEPKDDRKKVKTAQIISNASTPVPESGHKVVVPQSDGNGNWPTVEPARGVIGSGAYRGANYTGNNNHEKVRIANSPSGEAQTDDDVFFNAPETKDARAKILNGPERIDAHAVSVEHNSGEKINKLDTEFEVSSRKRDFTVAEGSKITGEISTTKLESKIDNHVGQFRTELNIPVNSSSDNHVGQFRTELNIPVNSSTGNHVGQFRTELNIPVNSGIDNHAGRFRTELVIPIDSRTAVRKERENQKVSILKEDNGQKTLSYGNHDDKVILSVGSWSNSKNRLRQPTIHSVNMQNLARQSMQGKQTEGTSGLHIFGGFAFHAADKTKFHRLYE